MFIYCRHIDISFPGVTSRMYIKISRIRIQKRYLKIHWSKLQHSSEAMSSLFSLVCNTTSPCTGMAFDTNYTRLFFLLILDENNVYLCTPPLCLHIHTALWHIHIILLGRYCISRGNFIYEITCCSLSRGRVFLRECRGGR